MDSNGVLAIVVAGVAGLFFISLMFWGGHVLLNWLGDESPSESKLLQSTTNQPSHEQLVDLSVPNGQERLATQSERDDVNGKIEGSRSTLASRSVQL